MYGDMYIYTTSQFSAPLRKHSTKLGRSIVENLVPKLRHIGCRTQLVLTRHPQLEDLLQFEGRTEIELR